VHLNSEAKRGFQIQLCYQRDRGELATIYYELEKNPLSTTSRREESKLQVELLDIEESRSKQKSRKDWLHLGKNTKFFHSIVARKHARNHISSLIAENGDQVSDTASLRIIAPQYFETLFNQTDYWK